MLEDFRYGWIVILQKVATVCWYLRKLGKQRLLVSAQSRVNHCPLRALTQLHKLDLQQQQDLVLQETGVFEALSTQGTNRC